MEEILENKEQQLTSLSKIGEFELIDRLTKKIVLKNSSSQLGVGDDAAVIDTQGRMQVVSTDLLVEGIHFDSHYSPLKHLGYKAIAVNLSDIAAMNARPEQVLVSIAVSSKYSVEAIEELYAGMYMCCERYGVDLVGGDMTSSVLGLTISVTALGYAQENKITKRSGMQDKELICVTGDLGAAYMGLLVLEREKKVFMENPTIQPDLSGYDYLLERQLKPEPRLDIVQQLEQMEIIPTAMIDISDGLASEIIHLCRASDRGCRLFEDKIPIDPKTFATALEFGISPTTAALNGGEDYELLFTVQQSDFEKVKKMKDVSVIGFATSSGVGRMLTSKEGVQIKLKAQGFDAYKPHLAEPENEENNAQVHDNQNDTE
ncbi:MAG: thiamine-phosphate kinase [Bacteroidales bacterium]|jgi:thiamine-monophosphate kinase|nr:thiamine-phosphate kinase [Bacteroidales bacterium]